jgi:hypothetical protein
MALPGEGQSFHNINKVANSWKLKSLMDAHGLFRLYANPLAATRENRSECGSLRDGLNSRSMLGFKARMRLIRANIVGPPDASRISASISAGHSAASCSAFGSFVV